jgi:hypothetical protein
MEPTLSRFLKDVLSEPDQLWHTSQIIDIARLEVPEEVFGGRRELLRCDINAVWAAWYLEGIYDPNTFVSSGHFEYATVYSRVLAHVNAIMPRTPKDERTKAASTLAKLIQLYAKRRSPRKRPRIERETKLSLLDSVTPNVRCWICGFRFSEAAIRRFEGASEEMVRLPEFVDFYKPSGLGFRDHEIEVDHISPFSAGGPENDNLALACGWCNRHKAASVTMYDQVLNAGFFDHPTVGKVSIPRPYWVTRLLAIRRRCEYDNGCESTCNNCCLTVSTRNPYGAANPTNLIVVCDKHDPMKEWRFISRQHF